MVALYFHSLSFSSRIICLADSCQGQGQHDTMDFCDKPRCLSKEAPRSDLPTPHLPTHDILKTRRVLPAREFGNMYRAAITSLQVSREVMKNGVDPARVPNQWNVPGPTGVRLNTKKDKKEWQSQEAKTMSSDGEKAQALGPSTVDEARQTTNAAEPSPESSKQRPRCIACNQIVSSPCWYCVECPSMSAVTQILFPALIADSL
jgi:hypothetical protein